MNKELSILILLILFCTISKAQISGQLLHYESPYPFAEIYFEGSDKRLKPDFDGKFELDIPKDLTELNLVLEAFEVSIIIKNIDINSKKLTLGSVNFPEFKFISDIEYKELSNLEKEECGAVYCWTELLGYLDTNFLSDKYSTFNCESKIEEIDYDPETKKITIDWQYVKSCIKNTVQH